MQDHSQSLSHYEQTIVPHSFQMSVPQLKQYVFDYMTRLHGWCSNEKAAFLMDLIFKHKPQTIVEIGVWGGKSLLPMATALKANGRGVIYGIDPWDSKESVQWVVEEVNRHFWEYADHTSVYLHLLSKVSELELQNQIVLIKNTSEGAPPIYGIDMLHVDGNHSDHTSYRDVIKWVPFMNSGGIIIFDDMKWFEHGDFTTARASKWLDENCIKFAEFTDICTWGVWIKP